MSELTTRDPDADAWISEMERMRDQSIELITSRFQMVIQSLDTGEPVGEVTAVLFVADDERVGLSDALQTLLTLTDADRWGNGALASCVPADASEISDVAEVLA